MEGGSQMAKIYHSVANSKPPAGIGKGIGDVRGKGIVSDSKTNGHVSSSSACLVPGQVSGQQYQRPWRSGGQQILPMRQLRGSAVRRLRSLEGLLQRSQGPELPWLQPPAQPLGDRPR